MQPMKLTLQCITIHPAQRRAYGRLRATASRRGAVLSDRRWRGMSRDTLAELAGPGRRRVLASLAIDVSVRTREGDTVTGLAERLRDEALKYLDIA